jgi:hypothetical protein
MEDVNIFDIPKVDIIIQIDATSCHLNRVNILIDAHRCLLKEDGLFYHVKEEFTLLKSGGLQPQEPQH